MAMYPFSCRHGVATRMQRLIFYLTPYAVALTQLPHRWSRRYDDGWPTPLSRSLLHMPPDALPSVVLRLQLHATLRSASQLRTEERVVSADMSRGGKPWVSRVHSAEISVSQVSAKRK